MTVEKWPPWILAAFLDYKENISKTFTFNGLRRYELPLLDPGRKTWSRKINLQCSIFFNTVFLENVHFLQGFKLQSLIHGHFHQCPSRRSIVLTFVCYWPNDLRGSKILLTTEAEYWICLIKKTREKEQHFIDKMSMIVIYNGHRIWSMVAAEA